MNIIHIVVEMNVKYIKLGVVLYFFAIKVTIRIELMYLTVVGTFVYF